MSLEVRLRLARRDPESVVEATFTNPQKQDGLHELEAEETFALDRDDLRQVFAADPTLRQYGNKLSTALFGGRIKDLFSKSLGVMAYRRTQFPNAQDEALRIRIRYDPAWNNLGWETLTSPDDPNSFLAVNEHVMLTREVRAKNWGSLVASDFKRALLICANPPPNEIFNLPQIDVQRSVGAATRSLTEAGFAVTCLTTPQQTTWSGISAAMEDGFDVWYVICHGVASAARASIVVTGKDGAPDIVDAAVVEQHVNSLLRKPSLVFLLSCHSAGSPNDMATPSSAFAWALAPRLVATGIPAVIAMQGAVSQAGAEYFAARTLSALRERGDVERAVAIGRRRAKEDGQADWWCPCLFSLAGSAPLMVSAERKFSSWDVVVDRVRTTECIPILGFGLGEPLFGPVRRLVQQVARHWAYPLWDSAPVGLPKIAQYATTMKRNDDEWTKQSLLRQICDEIILNHREQLSDATKDSLRRKPTSERSIAELRHVVRELAAPLRARANDPYRMLAALPCNYYITTMPDDLLEDALKDQKVAVGDHAYGREPYSQACDWRQSRVTGAQQKLEDAELAQRVVLYNERHQASLAPAEPDLDQIITADMPYVYHLFGRLDPIKDWVVTEDDYFNFLQNVSRERTLIPTHLIKAIKCSTLLFLGFELDQWSFKVLLQIIQDTLKSSSKIHIAVQLNASDQSAGAQIAAMEYLSRHLSAAMRMDIYWGSTQQFLTELHAKLQQKR